MGHRELIGASPQGLRGDALPTRIADQARDDLGNEAAVDVLWDLSASVRSLARLAATGRRLPAYDAIVVVIATGHVLAASRHLLASLAAAVPSSLHAPEVVVVLASHAADTSGALRAAARIHEVAASLPGQPEPTVVHAAIDPSGAIQDSVVIATAVTQALGLTARPSAAGTAGSASREVEVDRAVRTLRGRTSDLRRALTLAQSSFDVPYAQLNLVSRGTLRSLAYIGRSSDGLQRSLSAEAVQLPGPMLIADTHLDARFSTIPQIRGTAAIRYYIGHPVRSNSGHAVGVLCVLDTEPHPIEHDDHVLIRDLALLAEGELAALTTDT